jgi:hypothetical protein
MTPNTPHSIKKRPEKVQAANIKILKPRVSRCVTNANPTLRATLRIMNKKTSSITRIRYGAGENILAGQNIEKVSALFKRICSLSPKGYKCGQQYAAKHESSLGESLY